MAKKTRTDLELYGSAGAITGWEKVRDLKVKMCYVVSANKVVAEGAMREATFTTEHGDREKLILGDAHTLLISETEVE